MKLNDMSIIQYQNVSEAHHKYRLWLPINAFKKQLDFFSNNNFNILSIDNAVNYMEGKTSANYQRPISLTFDNGFIDFFEHAYPALLDYNFPSTLLISPMKVGKKINIGNNSASFITWEMLDDLIKNNVTIGAYEDHTWNINDVPQNLMEDHIKNYKKILEDKLGVEIDYFGVKEGIPNLKIRDLLISEGYRAFLTQCPTNRRPDLYSIGRIQVDDDDFNIFLTKVSRVYLFFKDKRSWKYIRKYKLDKIAHRLSETFDRMRGVKVI
ncbi:polysaccharide deacetylase family protein [Deltaproteobacteria bacterium]|nr:polysaccharide deacetylase family protein [Deltaproteobacteria bacterium]